MEALKNAIESALIERYGEITDRGCYVNGSWFSTEQIFNLMCDIINVHDDLFIDEEEFEFNY